MILGDASSNAALIAALTAALTALSCASAAVVFESHAEALHAPRLRRRPPRDPRLRRVEHTFLVSLGLKHCRVAELFTAVTGATATAGVAPAASGTTASFSGN